MEPVNPVERHQKLARYWSERQEREILVRIHYTVSEEAGCRVYEFQAVEELCQ